MSYNQLHEEMRPQAEERVKEELLLESVAHQQNITVSDAEVLDSIRSMAEAYRQPLDQMVAALRSRGDFDILRSSLLINKASEYLASTVSGAEG
jgi:trigger factor